MKTLRIKWKKFADEYIKTGNVYQSAINAGYSENYAKSDACKILEKPSVKAYVDKKLSELEAETIAESKEVLQYLTSVLRGETHDEVYYKTEYGGEALGQVKVQNKDRLKAAELLMRRFGLNTSDLENKKTRVQVRKAEAEIESLSARDDRELKIDKFLDLVEGELDE